MATDIPKVTVIPAVDKQPVIPKAPIENDAEEARRRKMLKGMYPSANEDGT